MKKYDGWILKSKGGSLLMWTFETTRREVITKKIGIDRWEKAWKHQGCKLVKVKLMEVK